KLPVPENLVKRVEKPRIVNADIYTKAPDFFGTYLLSGPKFYGLISSKITKGYISTYENVASGNIQTWGTIESSRKIDYIDKQNGFTRVINKNRGDYILNKDIESKIVAINSGLSKILAVGDAGSITNLKIFKLTPQETSEGIITANGQPEGTVIYTFSNEYTPNASKTISPTSIIYNYAEFGKGLYALIYKGEAYPFKIE
nr:hypothetical protein [Haliscomenobacter sp.]